MLGSCHKTSMVFFHNYTDKLNKSHMLLDIHILIHLFMPERRHNVKNFKLLREFLRGSGKTYSTMSVLSMRKENLF